ATTAAATAATPADPAAEPPPPTAAEIAAIKWDELPPDTGFVTPFANDLSSLNESDERRKDWDDLQKRIDTWAPAQATDPLTRARNLIAIASLMDIGQGQFERELAFMVYSRLKALYPKEQLVTILATIGLHPERGEVPTSGVDVDIHVDVGREQVNERLGLYALKMLGRLLGKLPLPDSGN
ncbi:MAG: hypothetical protein H0X38_17665, partial [Planctomycetes bacterium]|nr:hypothetical protein [Planctomycetota bacterium]